MIRLQYKCPLEGPKGGIVKNPLKISLLIFISLSLFFQTANADPVIAAKTTRTDKTNRQNILLQTLKEELSRSMTVLTEKGSPPPYFIGYQMRETHSIAIGASFGALSYSNRGKTRLMDIDVRVGNHKLDNTHQIRGSQFGLDYNYSHPISICIENDPDAIKSDIWLETDRRYKAAVERMIQIQANKGVTVKEEDSSNDFSVETPHNFNGSPATLTADKKTWEKKLKNFSLPFKNYPEIHTAEVSLSAVAETKYFVNSEETELIHGRTHWRITIIATTRADDGMQLYKTETFDARNPENLPDDNVIEESVKKVIDDLLALRTAPLMEPFTGPAILSGRASAVFFHEIFGHRIEGHRQKDENEGQTFTKMVNKEVLPPFISVYDDPTLKKYDSVDLNGHYLFDDEGVKSQRVALVQNGILKNFLMSRSPIEGFDRSNGHGRSQAGRPPVSRQGTLIIEPSKTVPMKTLRKKLLQECKAQGKDYGLLFDDISGGSTHTQRFSAQSFNVTPIMVYRVYVDGRPDELVRGVSLIGTPLTSFSKIIACGGQPGIFNGYCGAESGTIPASAISPPVLTTQIEVQKTYKESDKPPVLPSPPSQTRLHSGENDDVIIDAVSDEMTRSMESLKIDKMEKPYFIEYTVNDLQRLVIEAEFGALKRSGKTRQRLVKVGLRVGDYQLDNTNFLGRKGLYSLIMSPTESLVLENDYFALRRSIWLITDRAYKQALEELADKKSFIKNQVQVENIPDFSREKSTRLLAPRKTADFKALQKKWAPIVKKLSGIFREFPNILDSNVQMEVQLDHKYYINSEGTLVRQPNRMVNLVALGTTLAPDGMKLTHFIPFYAVDIEEMPSENELVAAVRNMAEELNALTRAPVMEDYIGPVLFTGQASAEVFAQVLAPHFSGQRPPLSDRSQMPSFGITSKLVRRINRRILPRDLSIQDNPTLQRFGSVNLIGAFPVDDEGVATNPVPLVENGILKTLLMSRRPRKLIQHSNGHGRAPLMGTPGVQIGNLIVSTKHGKSYRLLKNNLRRLCKEQKLPYGLIIKTFDNPSITGMSYSMSAAMLNSSQTAGLMSAPVLIFKVDTESGKEELVRGMAISEMTVKDLKYMLDAGNDYFVHQRIMPPGGGIYNDLYLSSTITSMGIPTTIIAPSILFEEIELKKNEEQHKRPPILAHPHFIGQ
jgi:predicted Zn-dependent protease